MTKDPVVYIIDDDEAVLRSLAMLLTTEGFTVDAHRGSRTFFAACGANPRGCLVADMTLEGENGLDVQRKMRDAGILMPIIFITGWENAALTQRATAAGAFAFFNKPTDANELLDAIRRALAKDAERSTGG